MKPADTKRPTKCFAICHGWPGHSMDRSPPRFITSPEKSQNGVSRTFKNYCFFAHGFIFNHSRKPFGHFCWRVFHAGKNAQTFIFRDFASSHETLLFSISSFLN
jgi:hypothetical protein